jgi:hypothetical protein
MIKPARIIEPATQKAEKIVSSLQPYFSISIPSNFRICPAKYHAPNDSNINMLVC